MRNVLTYTTGIVGLAIGLVAGSAIAQTTAVGPYYATPSWDQTLPASARFIVLSNMNSDAVLDRETGVVWQRSPLVTQQPFFSSATLVCLDSKVGNRLGWRLPTVSELQRLFDPTVTAGVPLPPGHPFTGLPNPSSPGQLFWTVNPSSQIAGRTRTFGYGLRASNGTLTFIVGDATESAPGNNYVWCVTGGLYAGPQ